MKVNSHKKKIDGRTSIATAAERNRRRQGATLRNARPTTARTTTPWRRFYCTNPPPAMPSLRGWTWTRLVRPRRLSRRPSRASSLPPLFFLLQGAIIRQSSAPAHARARSFDPVTRTRDGGIAARSRSPEDRSESRRARCFEPPTPRLAEAREESVHRFLGLLVVCGDVGGPRQGFQSHSLGKACRPLSILETTF